MTYSVDDVARVCHEAWRALQIVTGDPVPSVRWEQAPDWQKAAARAGVNRVINRVTPEEFHESWCRDLRALGWHYGPEEAERARTHPCLVPYEHLPEEQRVKDRVFRAVVTAMLGA